MTNFNRTPDELEINAVKWWPEFLSAVEDTTSVIPLLVKTQDKFLSLLTLCDDSPGQVFELIKQAKFPANLFLKHLAVLSDFGGEPTQRLNRDFSMVFPSLEGKFYFEYIWHERNYNYIFKALPARGTLNNMKLRIDGKSLTKEYPLDDLTKDLAMILMFGSNSTSESAAHILSKCEIGNLLGEPETLKTYVKQRYIHVSRITGGAQANTLGQVAQTYVLNYLQSNLGKSYEVVSNGHVDGVTQNDGRTLTTFDVVVRKGRKSVPIEISFQVTTNSTIERKAGQAAARQKSLNDAGCSIAYIIDGAGNFQRQSAIKTICANSDCTVAYSNEEFNVLVDFIKGKLK